MANYSIREVENLTGIKAHTLRIWEKRYAKVKPTRTDTQIRRYSEDELKMLLNISILNKSGMKISKVVEMSSLEMAEKVVELFTKYGSPNLKLESLVKATVDLDEHKFNKILDIYAAKWGIEGLFEGLVFPFIERIGLLWQISTVTPIHKYFALNIIKRKIIVTIDQVDISPKYKMKKLILFLPEGQHEELVLLFYHYIVLKTGAEVYYFGSSVSVDDLIQINTTIEADYFLTCHMSSERSHRISEELSRLSYLDETKLIVTEVKKQEKDSLSENIIKVQGFKDLLTYLRRN